MFSSSTKKTKRIKSIVELILNGEINSHQLYFILDQKSKSAFDFSDDYDGLGSTFHQKSRHELVTSAFKIDDTKGCESVEIANINLLLELAKAFKKERKHGITPDTNKFILCAALIFNQTLDITIKRKIADQLEKIYCDTKYKKYKDSKNILEIIRLKMTPTVTLDENPTPIIPEIKATNQEEAPAPAVIIPIVDTKKIQKEAQTINLINTIRKSLLENINRWHQKTSFAFFGGGTTIPNPKDKNNLIRVPNGIASMIKLFQEKNLLSNEIASIEQANEILPLICKIALQRIQKGERSPVRHNEINRFYTLIASLTALFDTKDVRKTMTADVSSVTVESENITDDLINEIESLFSFPNHSNIYLLKK